VLETVPHPIHADDAGDDGVVTIGRYIGALNEANQRITQSRECLARQRGRYAKKGRTK
jgi:hypothetical protein